MVDIRRKLFSYAVLNKLHFYSYFLITCILTIKTRLIFIYIQARFACLRCAAGGHFVSAGSSIRSPGVTLVNYKGDKELCPNNCVA